MGVFLRVRCLIWFNDQPQGFYSVSVPHTTFPFCLIKTQPMNIYSGLRTKNSQNMSILQEFGGVKRTFASESWKHVFGIEVNILPAMVNILPFVDNASFQTGRVLFAGRSWDLTGKQEAPSS